MSARWSAGHVWEPNPAPSDPYTPSIWGDIDPNVNYPEVIIGGITRSGLSYDLTWRSGRSGWMADPEAGTAYVALRGQIEDINVGDAFLVTAAGRDVHSEEGGGSGSKVLWTGRVDNVLVDITPDGRTTRVTASDWLAIMSRVVLPEVNTVSFAAGNLAARLADLSDYIAVPSPVRIAPSSASMLSTGSTEPVQLPVLDAEASGKVTGSLLDYLASCERASNAIVGIDPDGGWVVLPRASLPDGYDAGDVPLTGTEEPFAAGYALSSADRVINSWSLGTLAPKDVAASIVTYGRRTYTAESKSSTTAIWDAANTGVYYGDVTKTGPDGGFLVALSQPMAYATAKVRIWSRNSPLIGRPAFSFVSYNGRVWQVLGVEHRVEPEYESVTGWSEELTLDATQNDIGSRPTVPVTPPANRETVTTTFSCDRDSYIVNGVSADGGNGASDMLLVGLLSDGNLTRSLLRFNLTWPSGRNKVVKSALLTLYTSTQECLQFGSDPDVTVRRNTAGWSEGSYSTKCGWSSSNSVTWPGPSSSSTGAVTKDVTTSESAKVEISINTIAQAWADGSANYGVQLRAVDEGAGSDRTEFCSRHHATSSRRPTLVVTYERDVA